MSGDANPQIVANVKLKQESETRKTKRKGDSELTTKEDTNTNEGAHESERARNEPRKREMKCKARNTGYPTPGRQIPVVTKNSPVKAHRWKDDGRKDTEAKRRSLKTKATTQANYNKTQGLTKARHHTQKQGAANKPPPTTAGTSKSPPESANINQTRTR
jgi:hypothetical protein